MANQCFTADNVPVLPTQTIWVVDGSNITSHVVKDTEGEHKIIYDQDYEEDDAGIGCRSSSAFASYQNAVAWVESQYIKPEFDKDEARIIRSVLSRELLCHQSTTNLLRIAKDRDLTETERFQLPILFRNKSREELAEQIDPWISLEMTYGSLIDRLRFPAS